MSFELQEFIFEKKPKRRELLQYQSSLTGAPVCIQIFRNHSFELIEHTIAPYLDYSGIKASFAYSNYDDSFSFMGLKEEAELVILWIDCARYSDVDLREFLTERLNALRAVFTKPVLVIPFRGSITLDRSDVEVLNLDSLCAFLGDRIVDERALTVTGTALSSNAMLHTAKVLGLQYLPVLLRPACKGIVVDFDNTLYQGVLGEDGISGVVLTPGHIALQQELKRLADQGFFLCAASKNELADVCELLDKREDFPLKREDFTKLCVSWEPKAKSISDIAAFLNIHPNSLVFVDDNIGELESVRMVHPEIRMIHAKEDASITTEVLKSFPGLLKLRVTADDAKRSADVRSNEARKQMQQSMSQEDYIRSLQLQLTYELNRPERITRVAELAKKTNQFIFNYKRYTEAEVKALMTDENSAVLSLCLADKLSDSGLVGVFAGTKQGNTLVLEECFISCRALGRGIDDAMVKGALQILMDHFRTEKLLVQFQSGPRNAPAETFVNSHLSAYLQEAGEFNYAFPEDLLQTELICF